MDYLKNLVGGSPSQAPIADDGFADYAAPAAASPVSIPVSAADASAAEPTGPMYAGPGGRPIVYTKWYRVWERTELSDFYFELGLVPFILTFLFIHFLGTRRNRRKARKFMAAAGPVLDNEFAVVGFGLKSKDAPFQESDGLISAAAKLPADSADKKALKEKTAYEFETYATGRANTAFIDIRIVLWKWYNPLVLLAESMAGLFIDSVKQKPERIECIAYAFDGHEKEFVPPPVPGSEEAGKAKSVSNSTYEPFIFAIVNKLTMRRLRDDRYDLSLTFTKDHAKLPIWSSVMSESAEITDLMLTPELIKAVELAGDYFEYFIVSDQPIDKPTTLDEAKSRKRLHMCVRIPADKDYAKVLPLLQVYFRFPDHLVASGHFRPEVVKKVKQMRDTESGKLRKVADKEAEEERTRQMEKLKKEERDRKMKGMSAEEQRKFLEKEAEKNRRKQSKKQTLRG